jgi:colanic acid biosynthesis glycosyl transferase WcaI
LSNGITAWLTGLFRRIPTVYNVQDLVPEAYIQFGVLKNPTLIRFFEWIEKLVYRKNTHVSVISESFAEHLRQKGVPSKKISVIPNFVDVAEIAPLPRHNALSKIWELDRKFVVMHAGSIAYRHGVEVLVDAAKLLVHEPEILFFVVGGGSKRHVVEARAKEANLQNFRMMGYVERDELRWLRASADVQMIVLRHGMTSHSVPCKVYEIMASGRPFVAAVDEGSTICEMVKQFECGIAVTPESPKEIADAVLHLYYNRERWQRLAENGRREAVGRYSAAAVAKQYDALFHQLVQQR